MATKKSAKSKEKKTRSGTYIAALGASAGGLESLETFFSAVPDNSDIAYVVITHMEPTSVSLLPDLLQKKTTMKVLQVKNRTIIKPDHVYVIPPDHNLRISRGVLYLEKRDGEKPPTPINHFFRSLAEDQKEHAIGVVLSGMGTDGTIGLKAIKENLGLIIAQDPDSARYKSMTRSAIDTGIIDYVLHPENMPEKILRYIKHDRDHLAMKEAAKEEDESTFKRLLYFLTAKSGYDFSNYKRNTIIRRIRRRMSIHQIESMNRYLHYVQENPHEINGLFKELLISVTNFFRDPEAFQIIKDDVFPELFDDKPEGYKIRIWVPGVATGEEAYSIAMVLKEYMEENQKDFDVQIFATDIDEDSVETARAGVYPSSISQDVSESRLKQFFEKDGNAFRINSEIREMIIFASQNLIKDPPFTRLDYICCRNLLIYLDYTIQKKVMPLFHYSLKPGGILFLGSSESVGEFTDLFEAVNSKWKIFRRKHNSEAVHPIIDFPLTSSGEAARRPQTRQYSGPGLAELTAGILLDEYAPAAVVVDKNGDIIYIQGRTGKYLEHAPGKPSNNIKDLAREGLNIHLPAALRISSSKKEEVRRNGVRVKTNGNDQLINLVVRPLQEAKAMDGLFLVKFEDIDFDKNRAIKTDSKSEDQEAFNHLELELKDTKESLQTTIEELETSNEELKSMNEEYQSTNEELKSANEELETSREELQSLNEELATVNSELQEKIEKLRTAHEEMQVLMDSLDIPTIFLDKNLCIKRYTYQATELINLLDKDIGRPLHHISTNMENGFIFEDAQEVFNTSTPLQREVRDKKGRWFLKRTVKYRLPQEDEAGVAISFLNIHNLQRVEEILSINKQSLLYAENIVEMVREPFIILNREFEILSANKVYYSTFKSSPENTEGKNLFEVEGGMWDIPGLHQLLEEILPHNKSVNDFVVEHNFPETGYRKMILNARQIILHGEFMDRILLGIRI
ncbi:MAG: CheR family methyltransferase [Calditrichia bacterium]